MWITQALRDIDLMTNQGQSVFVFVGITSLIIPLLLMIIAPLALMIAVAYVLNKLGNDSELIVMNSAGMPPKDALPALPRGRHRGVILFAVALASISPPRACANCGAGRPRSAPIS